MSEASSGISMLAIIPARGGSKRIPRKNIRLFLDRPVISFAIGAALESGLFDEVMVSTDDDEIAEVARKYGAAVPFMRSNSNADDMATTADVLLEVIERYSAQGRDFDCGACIYPVTPLLDSTTLKESFEMFQKAQADALMPVIRYSHPIQRALQINDEGRIRYVNSEHRQTRTQDLPPRFHDAGQFYYFRVEPFLSGKQLVMENTLAYELTENAAQDIDDDNDWKAAEIKYELRRVLDDHRRISFDSEI